MDAPIEAFLKDALRLQGQTQAKVRESVGVQIAKYEAMFRDAQLDQRSKEMAARGCRRLFRRRIFAEMARCVGTPTEAHLRMVLEAIV